MEDRNIAVYDTDISTTINLSTIPYGVYMMQSFSKNPSASTFYGIQDVAAQRTVLFSNAAPLIDTGTRYIGNTNCTDTQGAHISGECIILPNKVTTRLYAHAQPQKKQVMTRTLDSNILSNLPTGLYVVFNKLGGLPNNISPPKQISNSDVYVSKYAIEHALTSGYNLSSMPVGIYEVYNKSSNGAGIVISGYSSGQRFYKFGSATPRTQNYIANTSYNSGTSQFRTYLIIMATGHCIRTEYAQTSVDSSGAYMDITYNNNKILGSFSGTVYARPLAIMP